MKDLLKRGPLRNHWERKNRYGFALDYNPNFKSYTVRHPTEERTNWTIENQADLIFDAFNGAIKDWQGKKFCAKRLIAYAWLSRELELAHLFRDGNGRSSYQTFISLVAGDEDLPMVMLEDPNVFDANGPEKLCYRILEGMDNFLKGGNARQYAQSNDVKSLDTLKIDARLQPLLNELKGLVKDKEWKDIHLWFGDYYESQCSQWAFFNLRTAETMSYLIEHEHWRWLRAHSIDLAQLILAVERQLSGRPASRSRRNLFLQYNL